MQQRKLPTNGKNMTSKTMAVQQRSSDLKSRSTLVKFLIIVLPMWVSAKFYGGPYMDFIRNYFAAILLIILFGLIFQLIFPKMEEKRLLVTVFAVLLLVQVVSFFAPSLFAALSFEIGRGNFFGGEYSLHMIPYYGVGGFIGYFILKQGRK